LRKFLIPFMLVFLMVLPAVSSAKKTGKIVDDSLYVDNLLGIQVTAAHGWKIKVFREKKKKRNIQRAVIVKKNFKINSLVRELHGDYTIPTVTIFADSTNMTIEQYGDMILDQLYKVNSDNEILLNTELLSETDFIDSITVKVNGLDSKRIQFKHRYKRFLDTSGRDVNWERNGGVQLMQDFNIIDLAIFKKGDWVILLYAVCEREFYQLNKRAIEYMLGSLKVVNNP